MSRSPDLTTPWNSRRGRRYIARTITGANGQTCYVVADEGQPGGEVHTAASLKAERAYDAARLGPRA